MRWLLTWFVLWLLITALLLLATGLSLWLLRHSRMLRAADGALWAKWTATALTLPSVFGALLATVAIFSIVLCAEPRLSLLHSCLHAVRHWCGHNSTTAQKEAHFLLWLTNAWLCFGGIALLLAWRQQPISFRLPPSAKLRRVAEAAGLTNQLPIWEAETDEPAGLVGVWRPFIFVANWLVRQLTAPALKVVLRHEWGHWRRWDHLTRWVLFSIAVLFGFVPFVRWLHQQWRCACEEAADDWAAPDAVSAHHLAFALQTVQQRAAMIALGLTSGHLNHRIVRLQQMRRPDLDGATGWLPIMSIVVILTCALSVTALPPAWFTLHCLAEVLLL